MSKNNTANESLTKGAATEKHTNRMFKPVLALILLLLILGGFLYMIFRNFVGISGQHLRKYSYSSGGGMTGGYYSETIIPYDETHALLSIETAEWHNQEPEVREYLVDAAVIEELEHIIRKYRMNFWNRKKFTNMFVYDGESSGYRFVFDDADIDFSSQIYPERYRKKLRELDDVVKKYMEAGEPLPTPSK